MASSMASALLMASAHERQRPAVAAQDRVPGRRADRQRNLMPIMNVGFTPLVLVVDPKNTRQVRRGILALRQCQQAAGDLRL